MFYCFILFKDITINVLQLWLQLQYSKNKNRLKVLLKGIIIHYSYFSELSCACQIIFPISTAFLCLTEQFVLAN